MILFHGVTEDGVKYVPIVLVANAPVVILDVKIPRPRTKKLHTLAVGMGMTKIITF